MAERELDFVVKSTVKRDSFAAGRKEIRQTEREIAKLGDTSTKLGRSFSTIRRGLGTGQIGIGRAGVLAGNALADQASGVLGAAGVRGFASPTVLAAGAIGTAVASAISRSLRRNDDLLGQGLADSASRGAAARIEGNLLRAGGGAVSADAAASMRATITRNALDEGRRDIDSYAQEQLNIMRGMQSFQAQRAFSQQMFGSAAPMTMNDLNFTDQVADQGVGGGIGQTWRMAFNRGVDAVNSGFEGVENFWEAIRLANMGTATPLSDEWISQAMTFAAMNRGEEE